MKTKFPLLKRKEVRTTTFSLEGTEDKIETARTILLTGYGLAACQQYLMAMIHYGNITELPFSVSGVYDSENIFIYAHDALHTYYSANKMLTAKARDKRNETYKALESYIFNSDYIGFDAALVALKTTKKIIEIDAEDIEMGLED